MVISSPGNPGRKKEDVAGKTIRVTLGAEELAGLDRLRTESGYSRSAQIEGLILAAVAEEEERPSTKSLAVTELQARVTRLEIHLANALRALAHASPSDRYRHGGRSERATSRHARRVTHHSRALAEARARLTAAEAA